MLLTFFQMSICESLLNPFNTAKNYEGDNLFGHTDEGIGSFSLFEIIFFAKKKRLF